MFALFGVVDASVYSLDGWVLSELPVLGKQKRFTCMLVLLNY